MFLDKIMSTFNKRFLPTRKKKHVSRKVRNERQRRNNNRIIPDNNDNNQNNSTSRTPRTGKKRTRPRMHAVPSTFLKRKDYIQYFLKNDSTGKHLPAFMRHQIDQVKEALKGVQSMQNNTIFQNYCNDQHCTLIDMVKLFYQIFGVSGDVVEEYYKIQKQNKNRRKQINIPGTIINAQVGSIYAECQQGKLQLRPSNEDSDGDFLMVEPKKLTKEQKNEKRQLTRKENRMIDETKGGHTCFKFSDTSSGFRCCCGNYVVSGRRKKKKRTSAL